MPEPSEMIIDTASPAAGPRPAQVSRVEARRLALHAQGFGSRPEAPSLAHIRKLASQVHAFQIDSVNVLVRAHYVPAYARLGPYRTGLLDSLTYGKRELFEYWGHEACLLPVSLYPLFRYRMHKHLGPTEKYMQSKRGDYMKRVLGEIAERGPLSASDLTDPGKKLSGWWGWWGSGNGKATLEHLYDAGLVAIAGRRGFERIYDLAERVIPGAARDAPVPSREEALKELICLAARACGVGTFDDFTAYFNLDGWRDRMPAGPRWTHAKDPRGRRSKRSVQKLAAELAEEKRLIPVQVEGWKQQGYLHPEARVPKKMDARAIVTPFDSLAWNRDRLERVFGMKYAIEMYTPAPKRIYGYYVCPFLLGDMLVARCDLKADRARGALMVQGAFAEPGQDARRIAPELMAELGVMREWLGLERVEVGAKGDLARALRELQRTT
jgi:uncharacterized protein YcaQ